MFSTITPNTGRRARHRVAALVTAGALAAGVLASVAPSAQAAPTGRDTVAATVSALAPDLPATGSHAGHDSVGLGFAKGSRQAGNAMIASFTGVGSHTDGVVRQLPNGEQAIAILRDAFAAQDITFSIADRGVTLKSDPLGGYTVIRGGAVVGRISAPWAMDAKGKSLPTSYTLSGGTLVQHVDTTGATFPVAADPHYTWGIITGTVYFNHKETRNLAIGAGAVAGFAQVLPPPFDVVFGVGGAAIAAYAAYADNSGYCLKVKSTGALGRYRGTEGDGYCR